MDTRLKLTTTQSNLALLIQMCWHTGLIRRKLREILQKHSDHEHNVSCLLCLLKESFTRLQKQAGIFTLSSGTTCNDDEIYIQKLNYVGRHSDLTDSYESILDTIRSSTFKDNSSINSSSSYSDLQDFTITFQHQRSSCMCTNDTSSHIEDIDESVLPLDAHLLVRNIRDGQSLSQSLQSILLNTESTICLDCNQQISVSKQVKSHPQIISVGLIWTEQVQSCVDKDITTILTVLQEETLSFTQNQEQVCVEDSELYITGIVCQFGQNYESYSYHTKRRDWINFTATQPPTQVGSDFSQVVDCILDREGLPVLLVFSIRQRGIGSNSSLDSQSLKMTHRPYSGAQNGFYPSHHNTSYAQDLGLTQNKNQAHLSVGSLYPNQSQYPLYPGEKQSEQVIYTSDYGSYSSQESNHSGNTLYSSLADCEEYMNQMKSQTPPLHTPPTNQSSPHHQTTPTHQHRPINDLRQRPIADDRLRGRAEPRGRAPTVNRKEKPKPPPRRSSSHGRLPSRRQLEHQNRVDVPSSYDDSTLLKSMNNLNVHQNGYPAPLYNNHTQSPHHSPAHQNGPSYATLPRKKKPGPATPIKPPATTGAQTTWMKQVAQKGEILHKHKSLSNDHERKTPNTNDVEYINRDTVQKILQRQKRVTNNARAVQLNSTNHPPHTPPPYQHHHSNQSSQSSHSSISAQTMSAQTMSAQQSAAVWDYNYTEPAEPATQVLGVIEPNKINNHAHGRQCSDETEFEFPPPPSESDLLAISQMNSQPRNTSITQSVTAPKSCISAARQNGVKPKIASKPTRPMLKSKSVTFQLSDNQSGTTATNSSTSNNEFIPPPPQFSTDMGYGDYELLSPDASCDPKPFQEQPHISKTCDQNQPSYSYSNYNQHYTNNSSAQYSYQPQNPYTQAYHHTHQYSTEL